MDERHLSYHGRAMLRSEKVNGNDTCNNDEDGDATAALNETTAIQQQQQQQQQLEYIQKIIHFIMERITYLQNECNIQILLVLDGATPPIKQTVVSERRYRRKKAVEQRDDLSSPIQPTSQKIVDEAITTEQEAMSRISASKRAGFGIDSTLRSLLHQYLLDELRSNKLPYLISPYEADGQLAYLSNNHHIDGIITEDSDLICLGVERLIYKLGGWNGGNSANRSYDGLLYGTLLERKDLGASAGIDLMDFSDAMLVVMFVAAGCDYCESLRGIGIVTARDVVANAFFTESNVPVLKRVLNDLYNRCHREARERLLPMHDEEKELVRRAYEKAFLGAVAMYRHPLVHDPILGDVIANDVVSCNVDNNCDDESDKVRVSRAFLRDEQILMQYDPYRELVTNREALYEVVGKPRPHGMAYKMTRGIVDRRDPVDSAGDNNAYGPTRAVSDTNNDSTDMKKEANVESNEPSTQYTNTADNINNSFQSSSQEFTDLDTSAATQPSTQEFSVRGRGTQQSKSSDKTLSSLSPDLLASPSSTKRVS